MKSELLTPQDSGTSLAELQSCASLSYKDLAFLNLKKKKKKDKSYTELLNYVKNPIKKQPLPSGSMV